MSDQPGDPASVQERPAAVAKANDHFTFGWLIVFCCYFLSISYIGLTQGTKVPAFTSLLLATLIIGCCWPVFLVLHIVRRRWQRLLSLLGAPFIAFTLVAVLSRAGVTSEFIRFEWNRKFYEAEVARLPQTGVPRFLAFNWGQEGGFVTSPSFFFTLVFDESDEIALPPEARSAAWQDRLKPTTCDAHQRCAVYESAGSDAVTVSKVTGHFYFVTIMVQ